MTECMAFDQAQRPYQFYGQFLVFLFYKANQYPIPYQFATELRPAFCVVQRIHVCFNLLKERTHLNISAKFDQGILPVLGATGNHFHIFSLAMESPGCEFWGMHFHLLDILWLGSIASDWSAEWSSVRRHISFKNLLICKSSKLFTIIVRSLPFYLNWCYITPPCKWTH